MAAALVVTSLAIVSGLRSPGNDLKSLEVANASRKISASAFCNYLQFGSGHLHRVQYERHKQEGKTMDIYLNCVGGLSLASDEEDDANPKEAGIRISPELKTVLHLEGCSAKEPVGITLKYSKGDSSSISVERKVNATPGKSFMISAPRCVPEVIHEIEKAPVTHKLIIGAICIVATVTLISCTMYMFCYKQLDIIDAKAWREEYKDSRIRSKIANDIKHSGDSDSLPVVSPIDESKLTTPIIS
ncbi:hypothetical protein AAMO2058_000469300 [Amorphochlora amoebiformis]